MQFQREDELQALIREIKADNKFSGVLENVEAVASGRLDYRELKKISNQLMQDSKGKLQIAALAGQAYQALREGTSIQSVLQMLNESKKRGDSSSVINRIEYLKKQVELYAFDRNKSLKELKMISDNFIQQGMAQQRWSDQTRRAYEIFAERIPGMGMKVI